MSLYLLWIPSNFCVTFFSLVRSDFAAAAVLITMGAVLGRASPFQLVVIAFFEVMFYSANEALNIHVLEAADIGGSMLIHTFGAYFGLAVSFMLYKKNAKDHPRNSTVYHSDLFAMIGKWTSWEIITLAIDRFPAYKLWCYYKFLKYTLNLDRNLKTGWCHFNSGTEVTSHLSHVYIQYKFRKLPPNVRLCTDISA